MVLDAETLAKTTATGFAGIFAGSAAYITIVQHPAVVGTDNLTIQTSFFYHMYFKAAGMQAPTAILSGASAIAVHYLQREKPVEMPLVWLYTGCLMVAIVPYTVVTMIPLNNQLVDTKACVAKGHAWVKKSLKRWVNLHNVRTGVSLVAFAGMITALASSSGGRGGMTIQ